MRQGRRYEGEPKLNFKKVFGVVIVLVIILLVIFAIKNGIFKQKSSNDNITSQSYFAVYDNNKWGVINNKGDFVIDPSYAEMIIVPDSKTGVFLCTYDVNYENGTYNTKALNASNQEIFTNYDQIEAIQNIDKSGNIWYTDNALKVKKDGKYGLINLSGKELTLIEYDKIETIQGIENALKVEKDGKYGIINNQGVSIISVNYADVMNIDNNDKHGYIVKSADGKYGVADYSDKLVLETKYDKIEQIYGNNLYAITENGTKKVVNKQGEDVITYGFDEIVEFEIEAEQTTGVVFKLNGKYGFMNATGETKINPEYDNLICASTNALIAKKDNKYGVITTDGEEKISFQYQNIIYNDDADIYIADDESYKSNILDDNFKTRLVGILIDINADKSYIEIKVGDEYKYYNFKFEEKSQEEIFTNNTLFVDKKNGKYGLIDKEGNVVVDYIYDDATTQNDYGYVAVNKDGKWGSIDSKGKVVIEPKYNLDNYLAIDFIGKWHKGLDLNMNYYSQE